VIVVRMTKNVKHTANTLIKNTLNLVLTTTQKHTNPSPGGSGWSGFSCCSHWPLRNRKELIELHDDRIVLVRGVKSVVDVEVCDVEGRSSPMSRGLLRLLSTRADRPPPDEVTQRVGRP